MKKALFALAAVLLIASAWTFGPDGEKKDWEMKQYYFVMLMKGPNRNQDSLTSKKLMEGHMANINKLADEGKLSIAGPFGDDGDWRGILILNAKTKEEAKEWVEADPAVKAGRLKYEIHPWWGGKGSVLK